MSRQKRDWAIHCVFAVSMGAALGCGGHGGGDSQEADTRAREKLISCGIVDDGQFAPETGSDDQCDLTCFLEADCDELHSAICALRAGDGGDPAVLAPGYSACVDACHRFACDGKTLPGDVRCDTFADCDDGSDEKGCFVVECPDGTTVTSQVDLHCDGFEDCTDGSDEAGCNVPVFTCNDGEKLPPSYECDLVLDCNDGSDEHDGCAVPICE